MDYAPLTARIAARFDELEAAISAPDLYDDPKRAQTLLREHSRARSILDKWDAFQKASRELAENRELASGPDHELADLARAEIADLETSLPTTEFALRIALLPPEPDEDKDAIVEIRAGTGGTEAALFAADLYRMYTRYAEVAALKIEVMDSSASDLGGLKEITFRLTGESVFRRMRYESGPHRVQRVPATETQGRIHTSVATVAVLPEAEEVDLVLPMSDLRIDVCRSGGPGGQGVNTTDSAVQITHLPTGRIVRCQDGRSQIQNKASALQIMRSRLLEDKRQAEEEKYSAHRKALLGGGGREEKVRTYNYAQNRVTDHRIGLTLYNLDKFIEGDIAEMIESLAASDLEARLAAETTAA
jgi:peptide chain release factor 1